EWFLHNTHPSHSMIARYTDELNRLPYRQKFPALEQTNIQFWFKNRRAKCKRMNSCI
ncbi:Putative LOC100122637, partial [Caligus rogercresseyi]